MAVINLNKDNFKEEISKGVVVVNFFADWSGPSRLLTPAFNSISEKFENEIKFFKVNVDIEIELSKSQSIKSVPTIMFYKNGKMRNILVGAQPKTIIENHLLYLKENR